MRYSAKFTPTIEDELSAYRMSKGERKSTRPLYILGGAVLAIEFAIIGHYSNKPRMALAGVLFGGIAAIAPYLIEWQIRRGLRKTITNEVGVSLGDEGIEFTSRFGTAKYSWNEVSKVDLDDQGLLLTISTLGGIFVPARSFDSGYFPRQELLELAHRKLRNA